MTSRRRRSENRPTRSSVVHCTIRAGNRVSYTLLAIIRRVTRDIGFGAMMIFPRTDYESTLWPSNPFKSRTVKFRTLGVELRVTIVWDSSTPVRSSPVSGATRVFGFVRSSRGSRTAEESESPGVPRNRDIAQASLKGVAKNSNPVPA